MVGIYNQTGKLNVEDVSITYNGTASGPEQVIGIKNSGKVISVTRCSIQVDPNGSIFLADGSNSTVTINSGTFSKDPRSNDKIKLAPGIIIVEENGLFVTKVDEVAKINRNGVDEIYSTLTKALSDAKAGETVVLLKDIPAANQNFTIDKSITLDLNGYSISSLKSYSLFINKYPEPTITVTVKNGTITNECNNSQMPHDVNSPIYVNQRVKLTLENMTLTSKTAEGIRGYGLRIGNPEKNLAPEVIINGEATNISGRDAGIEIIGNNSYGTASLQLDGGTVTGGNYGIAGNGTFDNTDITINGGTIQALSASGAAIYHPQDGNLTINDGTFEGAVGVQYLGAGKLSITGGTITANGNLTSPDLSAGDGNISDGAALSIISRGGGYGAEESADVSITGGTFTSHNNIAIQEYGVENSKSLIKTLEITQAGDKLLKVSGGNGQAAVQLDKLSGDAAKVITAGTFSSNVAAYFDQIKYMQNTQNDTKNPGAVVPKAYRLTYDYAGGALKEGTSNPPTYTYFDDNFILVNPIRTGYTFTGWTGTGLTRPTQELSILKGSNGDRSFSATWSANPAFIVFEVNGGSDIAKLTGVTDEVITKRALPQPKKDGYQFAGWFDEKGNAIEQLPEKFPAGTTTYTAKWNAESNKTHPDILVELPTVSTDGSPSAVVSDTSVTQSLKENAKNTLTSLQNGQIPESIPSDKAQEIKTLLEDTSDEDKVTVTISIQTREIKNEDANERQSILAISAPGEVPVVYLDFSVVMTLRVERSNGDFETIDNIMLSQVDEPILFEIHVDADLIQGKSVRIAHVHGDKTEIINPVSIDRENGIIKIYGSKFSTYALLTSEHVTVSFDSMGGSAVDPQTVPYHTAITKPVPPTKKGYSFDGWYTDKQYTNAYNFSDLVELPFTLYAKWTKVDNLVPSPPEQKTGTTTLPSNTSVKTGDTVNPAIWASLLLVSLISILAVIKPMIYMGHKHKR